MNRPGERSKHVGRVGLMAGLTGFLFVVAAVSDVGNSVGWW